MKPLFQNITKYNSKNYNQFIKFHGEKFNLSYNIYTLIMCVLLIYCIILNIIEKNLTLFLLFLTLFLLIIVFRLCLPVRRYQKTKKQFAEHKTTSVTVSFYKFYFTVNKNTFYYLKLYKIFETKDYFYLYINENNAVLVDKKAFTIGNANDFTEFIKKKCFLRYRKES